jgi:hypothetical protein
MDSADNHAIDVKEFRVARKPAVIGAVVGRVLSERQQESHYYTIQDNDPVIRRQGMELGKPWPGQRAQEVFGFSV